MNESDLKLVERIVEELDDIDNRGSVVFDTTFTQIAKTNLLLLKGLMDKKEEKGLFVVLDRPHQYMSYLLHMHDVRQENIWYIDTVTKMADGVQKDEENVNFLEDQFHVGDFFNVFESEITTGLEGRFSSMENIDFMILDNISTMLNYNRIEEVEKFIKNGADFISEHPHLMGGVTVDSESNPELYEVMTKNFDFIIDVEKLKKEVSR